MEFDNEIVFRIPAPSDGIETVVILFLIGALLVAVLAALQHRDTVARSWEWVKAHPSEKAGTPVNLLSWVALICVGPVAAVLFVMAVGEAYALLQQEGGSESSVGSLGRGAVIVALIGAPFVIWRSMVAQKTVNVTEQGHITDRINTAVQGLGAEKEVNRIGRPITIWTGKPKSDTEQVEDPDKFALPPRAIETRRYRDTSPIGHPDKNEYHDGLHVAFKSWPEEKTEIEWQGSDTAAEDTEHLAKVGDWKVFTRTEPNLEVRIGAIYALERIAQDSPRDHVQIMEILCAYIRQNAHREDVTLPESEAAPTDWAKWAVKNFRPLRLDIHVVLTILSRRWESRKKQEFNKGYQIDLRRSKMQKLELAWYDLTRANIQSARMEGAIVGRVKLKHADFFQAKLQGIFFINTELQGTNFKYAKLDGARFHQVRMDAKTNLNNASLEGASVCETDLTEVPQITEHLSEMFGDASVTLPGGHGPENEDWPPHWPKFKLDERTFVEQWHKWLDDLTGYTPPDPPDPERHA